MAEIDRNAQDLSIANAQADQITSSRGLDMSSTDDESSHDESIYADTDGAESVLQPAISPMASRMASSTAPAVERAAAMIDNLDMLDDVSSGVASPMPEEVPRPVQPRSALDEAAQSQPRKLQKDNRPIAPIASGSPLGGYTLGLQSFAQSLAPGQGAVSGTGPSTQSAMSQIFGATRHRRAQSAGTEALKKIRDALPFLPTSSSFLSSLPGSFFSHSTEKKDVGNNSIEPGIAERKPESSDRARHRISEPPAYGYAARYNKTLAGEVAARSSTANVSSVTRPRQIRRMTSHESVLYQTLSRTSSFGDDSRFENVREMANVRFKAIKDSLPDRPNFKLPSLPSLASLPSLPKLPVPLKNPFAADPEATNGVETPGIEQPGARVPNGTPASIAAPLRDGQTELDQVLETLTGDLVIMGGYRGSVLRSAEPPHHQLWAPVKLGLNMRKADLAVGLDDEDEASMRERIIPSGVLKNIGPIDIARKLFRRIKHCDNVRSGKLRLWDYGYDWRLSPHRLSSELVAFLEKLPSNAPGTAPRDRGAFVVSHSLGGLITRHAVNQRPELFAGVVYVGTPQRCVNILGPMRNGDAVLLNEKILTARVNFSLRTSFVLLPDDGACFVDADTGEEYPVDFFDADAWVGNRLSPCVAPPPLPPITAAASPRANPSLASLLPLLGRKDGATAAASADLGPEQKQGPRRANPGHATAELLKDKTLEPQMGASGSNANAVTPNPPTTTNFSQQSTLPPAELDANLAYLRRTLARIKQFRAELAHDAAHATANAYPPMAVMYGKDVPTVYAARVRGGRAAIARADAYDDLVFRGGDGVVLAREAMLPPGYDIVHGGRVRTDRGHVTMLGDLPALGRALQAVVRGRRKGIGLGPEAFGVVRWPKKQGAVDE